MASRAKIKSVFLTILLFVVLIPTGSWAVSPNEATIVGTRFITHVIESQGRWGEAKEAYVTNCNDLRRGDLLLGYHLSIYPHGHIVVSRLKQLPPVKSFSTTCDFDTQSEKGYWGLLKDTMQATLLFLQNKYRTLKEEKLPEGISPPCNREAWDWLLGLGASPDESTIVSPLLDTAWAQGTPFNDYCPMGDGGRSVAGCVAIAAVQVMKYWNHPSSGTGSHSYWWDGDGSIPGRTLSATFSDPYDWGNMLNSYSGGYNDAQAAAVAELCYEVGVAFEMDYGYGGSGAYPAKGLTAFPKYFKYKNSITIERRENYASANSWFDRIKEELNAYPPRPTMYYIWDGLQNGFAHEIVCDGYWETDEVDYIHMNYGWGGSHDNWYAVDNLYCGDGCDYLKESMLCGIEPNDPPNTPSAPTGPDSGSPGTSYSFTATTTDPDGDRVAFKFDWGDGSQSDWTSDVDSGSSVSVSHSWSSEGSYEVKVKAKDTNDAESGWSNPHTIVISRANNPPNTPSDPSPVDGATNQSINVDLNWTGGDPDSGDTVTYDVYFKANDSNFGEPISPGQSGTTYDPGTLSYNTHYYWKIVVTDNHGASTDGPVWDFTTGSSGRHENETFSLPAGKWKMISIPFILDNPSLNAVLVDDLGSQNDAIWKLYRWNTVNGSYDKYPYTGDFAAAKAFWIISKDAKEVDTGPGTDVSRETNFVINLPSGWSQIGNPFPFSVAWGKVRVRKDSEVVSISEAQARGWVRDKIWSWDGDSYIYYPAPGGELLPYEGHWVRVLLDCELLVPPSGAQEARAWEQIVKPKEEFLQLKAKVSELEDSYNFLGFYQTAKDGYDRLDVEEAPPISPYVSLFFPHPEWGKNKGDYTQDIRARITQAGLKRIWDFQVKTDQINKEIVLKWENTLAFPEDLHLYLTDSFSNVLANMREKSSYSFISSSGLESFKIVATSEALPLPEELHLSEIYSYPNPAHGEGVKFHFHLASSAKLTIKIYSISGELVKILVKDEVYLPGAYEEFWKEDNDRGERLARGLYIFIIQAGNPAKAMSKSGKVVLLD